MGIDVPFRLGQSEGEGRGGGSLGLPMLQLAVLEDGWLGEM